MGTSIVIRLFILAAHVPVQYILLMIIASKTVSLAAAAAAPTLPSYENGTRTFMYVDDDLYCLTQMPIDNLLKIQKTIGMMHAVADYDKKQMLSTLETTTKIDNRSNYDDDHAPNNNDDVLRELTGSETKNIFRFFTPKWATTTSTTTAIPPSAASFIWSDNGIGISQNTHFKHKTGYPTGWDKKEEKPSKIQKVLHFSITALSFLAFAGYLLCMVVQAIKSKGTTYYHSGILSTLTQATGNKIAGIKTNRYRRQAKVADRIFIAEPDPDSLYNALLMVAKGYVQLNRIVQPPI